MAPGRRGHAHGGPSREHIILSWKGWKAFEMNSEMDFEMDFETDFETDSETDVKQFWNGVWDTVL